MADWLLLRLPRTPGEPASWLVADAHGAPAGPPQSGPLHLAVARAAGRRLCVLVPGSDVLLAEPEVPGRVGAKLAQLVPYALEEQLADDIEELHFALGKRPADSTRASVAVVRRALLEEWLGVLNASGLKPETLHAESDLLPENPGQAVMLFDDDTVTVRPAGGAPVTLPADALDEALAIAQSGDGPASGARGLIVYGGETEWERHGAQVEAARSRFEGVKIQLLTAGPLALLAQRLPSAGPINLLQGAYAPTATQAVGLRAWRLAALLLAALVGLHVAGKVAELQLLKAREHKLDAAIRETFHTALPREPVASDPRHRMEQRLAAVRGAGGGLLPALQALAQARDSAPGTSVQSLSYKGGALDLQLAAPDAASLDRLSQSLRSNGWQADLTGGNNAASGYEGRVQMHASGT